LGDQLQTWDAYDGIKSTVVGMLSGGVSGFSLLHGDTGGFNAFAIKLAGRTIPVIARADELLMRWVELSAFTSVLRTHEGLNPSISAQVDSNQTVLRHFARVTKIYRALAFYRKAVIDEAARTGHPVVRALFLEYPDDPVTYALSQEFMFGSEFIVAPVLNPGRTRVRVYLPAGRWVNIWTGAVLGGPHGSWVETAAPLGRPAVFYRQGSQVGAQFVRNLTAENLR
jgi:alpha-glucosidase